MASITTLGWARPLGALHHGPAEVSALVPHQRLLTGATSPVGESTTSTLPNGQRHANLPGRWRSKALRRFRMTMCSAITRFSWDTRMKYAMRRLIFTGAGPGFDGVRQGITFEGTDGWVG